MVLTISSFLPKQIRLFDIRGQGSSVDGKLFPEGSSNPPEYVIQSVSETFNVSEKCLLIDYSRECCVLHDNVEDTIIVFITYIDEQRGDSTGYSDVYRGPTKCIGINGLRTVRDLEETLCQDLEVESVCIFSHGDRQDDKSLQLCSFLKSGYEVVCICQREEQLTCFNVGKQNIEVKCSLPCFNTYNVQELKHTFKEMFKDEFPDVVRDKYAVWFTKGKYIFIDTDFPLLKCTWSIPNPHKIYVHIKKVASVPIIINIKNEGKSKVMFTELPICLKDLRREIGLNTSKEPNSLRLSVQEEELKDGLLSEREGLTRNCIISVDIIPKTCLYYKRLVNGGGRIRTHRYLLDSVLELKRHLSFKLGYSDRELQLFFQGKLLQDNNTLNDYDIREGDCIDVVPLNDSIQFLYYGAEHDTQFLSVSDYHNYTVAQVKMQLAKKLDIDDTGLEIVLHEKWLHDRTQLSSLGLRSGDTVLVAKRQDSVEGRMESTLICKMDKLMELTVNCPSTECLLRGFYLGEANTRNSDARPFANSPPNMPKPERDKSHDKTVAQSESHITQQNSLTIAKSKESIPAEEDMPDGEYDIWYEIRSGILTKKEDTNNRHVITDKDVEQNDKSKRGMSFEDVGYERGHSSPEDSFERKDELTGHFQISDCLPGDMLSEAELKNSLAGDTSKTPGAISNGADKVVKREALYRQVFEKDGELFYREQTVCEGRMPRDQAEQKSLSPFLQFSGYTSDCTKMCCSVPRMDLAPGVIQDDLLYAVSLELGHEWKRLALSLNLTMRDIEAIEHRHSRDLQSQAMKALVTWRQRESATATPDRLKEVLRECELALIADCLDEKLNERNTQNALC